MATTEPPESQRQLLRDFVIVTTILTFLAAIALKLYVSWRTADTGGIDSTINLLVGFVSAIFMYLGIRIGRNGQ